MSHFTKCELRMTNLEAIKRALADLGHTFRAADAGQAVAVRGWREQTMDAAIAVDMGKYDVGVVADEHGTYDIVADWWGVETSHGTTELDFKNTLSQRYQYHNVLMSCEAKGYTLEEEVNEEDGSVQLVVRKWVAD